MAPVRRDSTLVGAISIALLIPCFWVERIQAGDISSHLYNAWLARLAAAGLLPGIAVVHLWTNVLGDWILSALLGPLGPAWTERAVLAAAVELFFWGSFFLLREIAGARPWYITPCLAMLAYGLIFHYGFLNFYLSTGLCLWILGLLWRPTKRRALIAAGLAVLAMTAHMIPVLWAAAVLTYFYGWRLAPRRLRMALPAIALCLLTGAIWAIVSEYPVGWRSAEALNVVGFLGTAGVDQVWLFGVKYLIVACGLLAIWTALLLARLDRGGFFSDPLVQLWGLHAAAFLMVPAGIQLPFYEGPLAYIPDRVSLFAGLALLMAVADASPRPRLTAFAAALAAVYFGFVLADASARNQIEGRITRLIDQLPPGQRVVTSIDESDSRVPELLHAADRACLGRCFSYGNYEPASKQFRVRVLGPNPYVADSMPLVKEIEKGTHIVTAREAPLYAVCRSPADPDGFYLQALKAGQRVCSFTLRPAPQAGTTIGKESAPDSTAQALRTSN